MQTQRNLPNHYVSKDLSKNSRSEQTERLFKIKHMGILLITPRQYVATDMYRLPKMPSPLF